MKEYPLEAPGILDRSYEKEIINRKYDYIEEVVEEVLFYRNSAKEGKTDNVDCLLTHRIWGVPVFLGIMALVFFLTFTIGDALKGIFEIGLDALLEGAAALLARMNASDWVVSLVVDGVIAGVGGILTFLPNIFILFLALGILEDSGYMARVAYVMDGIMGKVGLSGKAFLPMVLGFGCTVPAVMATRTLEKRRGQEADNAFDTVYVLFCEASHLCTVFLYIFGDYAAVAAFSMYALGLILAILLALVIGRFKKGESAGSLLMELPEYKMPNARTIAIYVWEKVKDYLSKAGTTIFVASIVIWFVLNFGVHGMVKDVQDSFGAMLGHWMEPLLAPAGFGLWQIGVALIAGLSAKEVVVSSMAVLFGISNINSAAGMTRMATVLGQYGFGMLNAYALMVFCLLYTPCMATVGTIKKESSSWKFTLGMVLFQLGLAYAAAVLVFQAGSMILG